MAESNNATLDESLHAADIESLEQRIMELAMERTGARDGAVFLWDDQADGLAIDSHVVDGLFVALQGMVLHRRQDGRPNGIAMLVLDRNEPYLCNDTSTDPHYAPYFQEVLSIAAAPVGYQDRAIGVISVSSTERGAFTEHHVAELEALAASSAKFLRRAQLYRSTAEDEGRPFLIKGISPEWVEVERSIERVSPTNAPVLVRGESGTGKDLVAHAIHFNSRRASEPFVTVNCAAIPETMLESLLFGHEKGAFTGATFKKVGEFEKADKGTLFLDEVGELPVALQAKVLRAVEGGEVQPLGSNKPPKRVDARLICATNRDLGAMVRDGGFREDLYYRLSVMTLTLPPLRSYKGCIETLARIFLQQAAAHHGTRLLRLGTEARALLRAYDYPGNVRELKNAMERAAIMAAGAEVGPQDLPAAFRSPAGREEPKTKPRPRTLKEMREAWLAPLESRYLAELLDECGGNVREAARRADVNTVTMYRLLKKRGLKLSRKVRREEPLEPERG